MPATIFTNGTESSGNQNQNEDSNVRYEDEFEKEDDANFKKTHGEEDENDKIKMSEVPAPIVTNDQAGVGSTVIGANGTVSEQDISPVSRSRQLRAIDIEDTPPANTLPSAAGTNSNRLIAQEKTLLTAGGSNSNESTPPGKIFKKAEDTSSSEATPLHVILQKASDSNQKRRLFNNSRDIPLDMEYNMPDDDGAFFAHLPIISYLDQKEKSIGKYNCPMPTTLKSKNTKSRRRIGKN